MWRPVEPPHRTKYGISPTPKKASLCPLPTKPTTILVILLFYKRKRDSRVKYQGAWGIGRLFGGSEIRWGRWRVRPWRCWSSVMSLHAPAFPVMAGFLSARCSADSSEHILILCTNGSALNLENTVCPNKTEKVSIHRITITCQSSVSAIIPR